jgi:hypothetical protein
MLAKYGRAPMEIGLCSLSVSQKDQPFHVGDKKGDESWKSPLNSSQVSVARLAVPRFYRREFRYRDQDLSNSLDDLLLLCCGELGQAERLVLHLDLACTTEIEFIVCLDCDRGQQRGSHQEEKAR